MKTVSGDVFTDRAILEKRTEQTRYIKL